MTYRTEDEVRDSAKVILGFDKLEPKVKQGTGQITTFNQLGLVWNVTPVLVTGKASIDETVEAGIEEFKKADILEKGDIVVISGGAKILNTNSENQVIDGVLKI